VIELPGYVAVASVVAGLDRGLGVDSPAVLLLVGVIGVALVRWALGYRRTVDTWRLSVERGQLVVEGARGIALQRLLEAALPEVSVEVEPRRVHLWADGRTVTLPLVPAYAAVDGPAVARFVTEQQQRHGVPEEVPSALRTRLAEGVGSAPAPR
jgi:hypothetical protein